MRTTLDIANDVLLLARTIGKRESRPVGQVISELARRGLQAGANPFAAEREEFLGFRPLLTRGHIVTPELIESLRDTEGVDLRF